MRQALVRRETLRSRYTPISEQAAGGGAPHSELPSGLVVHTPVGSESAWLNTIKLPWLEFISFLKCTGIVDRKYILRLKS